MFGLAQDSWGPNILFAIVSSVGAPICNDYVASKYSFGRPFGHFARVLVDVDLASSPVFNVLVKRKGFTYFIGIEYENLPLFYSAFKVVGHSLESCRKSSKEPLNNDLGNKKALAQIYV